MPTADEKRAARLVRERELTAIAECKARRSLLESVTERQKAVNLTFDAERRGRQRTRPRGREGSADSHRPYRTLEAIRTDCADLRVNNPIVRGMVRRLATNVGTEFRCHPATNDKDFNERACGLFEDWADDHDRCHTRRLLNIEDISRMAVEEWCWSGGLGVLKRKDGRVQDIEIARLRNENARANDETHVNGWEITQQGEPIAVHIAEWLRDGSSLSLKTARRPAAGFLYLPNMLHIGPGQRVTEPALCASVRKIEILDKFIQDSAHAATFAAGVGLIAKTFDPENFDSALARLRDDVIENAKTDGGVNGPSTYNMEGGLLWNLQAGGESLEQVKPEHPGPQFEKFVMLMARIIGQDLDLPYELALLDFSQSNFHSARGANSVAWRSFRESQRQLVRRLWQPLYHWRVARAILAFQQERDDVPVLAPPNYEDWERDFWRCSWTQLGQPILDPEKEIKAAVLAVTNNLKSRTAAIKDLGGDRQMTFEELEDEARDMERRKIVPAGVPGAVDPNVNTAEPEDAEVAEAP